MNQKISIHQENIASRLRSLKNWKIPPSVRAEIIRFMTDLELGKVNRGKRISDRRRAKYLDMLKVPLEFLKKPTAQLTLSDIERLEKSLAGDQLRSRFKHRPFMDSTKADFRKGLKIFLRWRLGPEKANRLAGWLDLRVREKTPDYLKESEILKLFKACRTAEQRFLVAVLFDSGARAEEFHNIRYEDVHLPEGKETFARIALKAEYSKTKGRVISLYWRHSVDAVKDYLHQRVAEGIRADEPVYPAKYDAGRQFLNRLGRTVLDRPIHYHLFRHSSATYYANKLNRQELCYRYGWKFSSDMPDIYISRAGMENKQLDEKFTQTEMQELKSKLLEQEQENQRLKEGQRMMIENYEKVEKKLEDFKRLLSQFKTK